MKKIITKSDITFLEIERIKKNPLNMFGEDKFEDLKNSIETYGLITPITVIGPDEDNCYVLIAGEQRLRVYETLRNNGVEGYDKIATYIVGDMNMSEIEQKILIESSNIDTRDTFDRNAHCFQIVKLLRDLEKEQGLTKSEFVKLRRDYMKCSDRYARFYEQVFDTENEELKDMFLSGELSLSRASRIATMPKDFQDSALQDIKNGENQDKVVKEVSEKIRELKKQENSKELDNDFEKKEMFDATPTHNLKKECDIAETKTIEKTKPKTNNDDFEISDYELDMYTSLGSNNYNEDYLENSKSYDSNNDDNDFDFDDFDFNTFDTNILECSASTGVNANNNRGNSNAKAVLLWCSYMKNVDTPSDAEWEVIEACKKIVEKFI